MDVLSDISNLRINSDRLLQRQRAMARIGATGRGGVNRQALSDADTEARNLLLSWTSARNFVAEVDQIGNLFIRRPGTNPKLLPIMTGSHLDSQPTGGNFDGVFGVLAGLEVLETLDDQQIETNRSAELVVWMNEEGSRFAPPTMGSAVNAGAMSLDAALATKDKSGTSVGEALAKQLTALVGVGTRDLGSKGFAFVEAHIEQGPLLEKSGCHIGVVTGIQGLSSFSVQVNGFEAHAGTTPVRERQDAFMASVTLIEKLRKLLTDPADVLRFTIGRLEVYPGSPNTVPSRVTFTIDLRHPNNDVLLEAAKIVAQTCDGVVENCAVKNLHILHSRPVLFDRSIVDEVRHAAQRHHIKHQDIVSGATHDSLYMSKLTPTAMIFVPCENGISHNELEFVEDDHLLVGGQVLCDVVVALLTSKP